MRVSVQEIKGPWDLGYSLDKHVVSSTYIGDDDHGHPRFDTTRSEVGEALFQLKYRNDINQITPIAAQFVSSLGGYLRGTSFVIPMPPSKQRLVQPVAEIAKQVAAKLNVPYLENLLIKTGRTLQMKDIPAREDKIKALASVLTVNDVLPKGRHDILVVDDLYDSGSSLEAATLVLRQHPKIGRILVVTATRRR